MGKLRDKKFKQKAQETAKNAGKALHKVLSGPGEMMDSSGVESLGKTAISLAKDPTSHPRHVSQQSTVPTDAKPRIVVKPLKQYKKPE